MHPEMKVALDNITRDLAAKHQVSTQLVNFLIQSSLLRTKLAVLGGTVTDRKGRINVKDSCEKMVEEVMNLTHLGAQLEITTAKEYTLLPSIIQTENTGEKIPAQVVIVNVASDVENAMQPIINQYFLGIEPGRKSS